MAARGRGIGNVVGLGLCVVDHLYLVDGVELAGTRTRYRAHARGPGGMVTNALVQAAALGCSARLLSLVGDDADGRALLAQLRARGVGTRDVVRSASLPTTTAVVLVDRRTGQRRFVIPDRRQIEREAPAFPLTAIRGDSILLIDGHFARRAQEALARARALGATVVADLADTRPAYMRMLPFVDYPIVPLEFVERQGVGGPRETLRALRQRFGGTPIVTLGSRGALALVDGRVRRIRPHRVRVRDTTGAGDAFHGAFAAGLARGLSVLEALDLASRAGAAACRALGGTASLIGASSLRAPDGRRRPAGPRA